MTATRGSQAFSRKVRPAERWLTRSQSQSGPGARADCSCRGRLLTGIARICVSGGWHGVAKARAGPVAKAGAEGREVHRWASPLEGALHPTDPCPIDSVEELPGPFN